MKLLAIGLVLLATTTVSRGQQQDTFPHTSDLSKVSITLTRYGGGLLPPGECGGASYSVTIWGSGKIVYQGLSCVRALGNETARISPAAVADLMKQINAIHYFSLKNSYDVQIGCNANGPYTETMISEPTRKKHILNGYCRSPRDLDRLENMIDGIANTKRWIFFDAPTLQAMITSGWNVQQEGPKYMEEAVTWSDPEVIGILVHAGVPIDGKNSDGDTCLGRAVIYNRVRAAKALLNLGADYTIPQEQFKNKPTPATAAGGSVTMAKLLLEKGAEINAADGHGDTMLTTASHQGDLEAIRFLIGHGAAVNARNVDGKTALGVAEQMRDMCGRDHKECRAQIRKFDRIVVDIRQHGGIR